MGCSSSGFSFPTAPDLVEDIPCPKRTIQGNENSEKPLSHVLTPSVPCRSKIDPQNMDKTLHAIQMVSGVLQGPFDLGNKLLGMKGVMEMMVALCGSEREIDQLVAVEALIHASTKLSRATFIISNGVALLKEIYKKTKNEKIKIRALVVRMSAPCLFSTCTAPHRAPGRGRGRRSWERAGSPLTAGGWLLVLPLQDRGREQTRKAQGLLATQKAKLVKDIP